MGKLVQNIHEDVLKVLIILVCGVFFFTFIFFKLIAIQWKESLES